eukprot:COSAG04_NODE_497_length_13410_cov_6.004658_4_plen_134_part_00
MSAAAGAATAGGDELSDRLVAVLGETALEKLLARSLTPDQVLKEFKLYDAGGTRFHNSKKKEMPAGSHGGRAGPQGEPRHACRRQLRARHRPWEPRLAHWHPSAVAPDALLDQGAQRCAQSARAPRPFTAATS